MGSTGDTLEERIRKHKSNHKGFTGGVGDWEWKYSEHYSTKTDAIRRENEIKKQKNYREDDLEVLAQLVHSIPSR